MVPPTVHWALLHQSLIRNCPTALSSAVWQRQFFCWDLVDKKCNQESLLSFRALLTLPRSCNLRYQSQRESEGAVGCLHRSSVTRLMSVWHSSVCGTFCVCIFLPSVLWLKCPGWIHHVAEDSFEVLVSPYPRPPILISWMVTGKRDHILLKTKLLKDKVLLLCLDKRERFGDRGLGCLGSLGCLRSSGCVYEFLFKAQLILVPHHFLLIEHLFFILPPLLVVLNCKNIIHTL